MCRSIHTLLSSYKDAKRGPTVVFVQSPLKVSQVAGLISSLEEFPRVAIRSLETENHYPTLDWQRVAARNMVEQFLNLPIWIQVRKKEMASQKRE